MWSGKYDLHEKTRSEVAGLDKRISEENDMVGLCCSETFGWRGLCLGLPMGIGYRKWVVVLIEFIIRVG